MRRLRRSVGRSATMLIVSDAVIVAKPLSALSPSPYATYVVLILICASRASEAGFCFAVDIFPMTCCLCWSRSGWRMDRAAAAAAAAASGLAAAICGTNATDLHTQLACGQQQMFLIRPWTTHDFLPVDWFSAASSFALQLLDTLRRKHRKIWR